MPARPFFQWELDDFGGRQAIEAIFKDYLSRLSSKHRKNARRAH